MSSRTRFGETSKEKTRMVRPVLLTLPKSIYRLLRSTNKCHPMISYDVPTLGLQCRFFTYATIQLLLVFGAKSTISLAWFVFLVAFNAWFFFAMLWAPMEPKGPWEGPPGNPAPHGRGTLDGRPLGP